MRNRSDPIQCADAAPRDDSFFRFGVVNGTQRAGWSWPSDPLARLIAVCSRFAGRARALQTVDPSRLDPDAGCAGPPVSRSTGAGCRSRRVAEARRLRDPVGGRSVLPGARRRFRRAARGDRQRRRRALARRVDAHHAGREEPLPLARPVLCPKGARDPAGDRCSTRSGASARCSKPISTSPNGARGVYGIEAAAQRDFRVPASALTTRQAALLATALPNPILRNVLQPSRKHRQLARRIVDMQPIAGPHVACVE